MRTAQELIDSIAALPSGSTFSAINSSGQYAVTFGVVTHQSPRRVAVNRVSNADLSQALDAGLNAALANLPE